MSRIGTIIIVLILAAAVFGPVVSPYSPVQQNLERRFEPPGAAGHILGTDDFGRDVATRLAWGARSALSTAGSGVLLAALIGLPLGLAAGLERRVLGPTIMLLVDAILSFPGILLAVALIAVLGSGALQVSVALGIMFAPLFARTVRAETLSVSQEGYVDVSRGLGTPAYRTVAMHVLPNVMPNVLVIATSSFALCITIEAALSFLGLGSQPPTPTWGLMLREARNYLDNAPHLAILPGLALGLSVYGLNTSGDALSRRFDVSAGDISYSE
ncbi:MAG: ABC transporter permease [Spirochaetales bacterium]